MRRMRSYNTVSIPGQASVGLQMSCLSGAAKGMRNKLVLSRQTTKHLVEYVF